VGVYGGGHQLVLFLSRNIPVVLAEHALMRTQCVDTALITA
jgi:hypothetical protein